MRLEVQTILRSCSLFNRMCVARRKQSKPGNTQESKQQSTQQKTSGRSSAGLTKPNQTTTRYTRAKDTITCVLHGESSKRLAPPRNTKDKKRLQSTQTTVNRRNRPSTKHYQKGSIIPISTAAGHAFSTATSRHHHPHPTASSPDPISQRSPLRSTACV